MKLENLLLKRTGGCGRYQLLLTLIIHSMKCSVCFTMLFMVFGTASSDWWCIEDLDDSNMTFTSELQQYQSCQPFNSSQTCTKFYFDESQVTTVITEWSLVCNKEWIKSTITSIQMAGVLIGNLVCGQVADVIGRKPPLFISIATLVVFNIVAAFSTSWIMFAAIRFCLGVGMGLYLADQHSLLSEFTIPKWRTLIEAIPTWSIQTVLLSLVAWLLKNWRYLHFATAAIGFPFVFTYWFVPESVEWYVSRNRLRDAVNVIKKVAEVNQSTIETPALKTITKDIGRKMLADRKYSYKVIIRNGSLFINTLLLVIVWFSNGLGTYGIQFGIPELSGNLYINIFIMALISCPLQFICVYLTNRIGKKISAIFFYTICGVSALIVAITYRLEESEVTKSVINIAAIVCLIGIYVASIVVHSLTLETYPKVIRNVGYGFQNTMARIGAIFGPQLVYLDSKFAGTLYWISGISAVISLFIILPLPGTINKKLSDTNNEREREETEEPDLSIEIIDENQTKNEAV